MAQGAPVRMFSFVLTNYTVVNYLDKTDIPTCWSNTAYGDTTEMRGYIKMNLYSHNTKKMSGLDDYQEHSYLGTGYKYSI